MSAKIEALESLAKAMSELKLSKLKGYKKTAAKDPMEDAEELPVEETEEEVPVLEAEEVDAEDLPEEDEDDGKPQSFSKMLASIAKKKSKTH